MKHCLEMLCCDLDFPSLTLTLCTQTTCRYVPIKALPNTRGHIFFGKRSDTGESVVIKELPAACLEIRILKLLETHQHPNLLYMKDAYSCDGLTKIVVPYYPKGDLFTYITRSTRLTVDNALCIQQQLHAAVLFMHSLCIVHRDLKPENVVMSDFNTPVIIDFEYACILKPGALLYTQCGSTAYISPEVFTMQPYDGFRADAYALGMTLFTMLAGFHAFPEGAWDKSPAFKSVYTQTKTGQSIILSILDFYNTPREYVDKKCVPLLDGLLAFDSEKTQWVGLADSLVEYGTTGEDGHTRLPARLRFNRFNRLNRCDRMVIRVRFLCGQDGDIAPGANETDSKITLDHASLKRIHRS